METKRIPFTFSESKQWTSSGGRISYLDTEIAPGITLSGITRGRQTTRVDSGRRSYWQTERASCSRFYVGIDNESVLENLINRSTRPVREWGKQARSVLPVIGLDTTLRWNIHAGCSMCPCSPGFVCGHIVTYDGEAFTLREWASGRWAGWGVNWSDDQIDLWLTIDYAVTGGLPYDPSPEAEAIRLDRLVQVAGDSTLSPLFGGAENQADIAADLADA